jgi:hypothetical protein
MDMPLVGGPMRLGANASHVSTLTWHQRLLTANGSRDVTGGKKEECLQSASFAVPNPPGKIC